MSEVLREQLSAFIDGELPAEECELLVRRIAASPELGDCWRTYHLIGDAVRGELAPAGVGELAPRVDRALEGGPRRRRDVRRVATIAAGVAVIGLSGLVGALVSQQVGGGKVFTSGGSAVSGQVGAGATQVDWRQAPRSVRAELNRYLLMHDLYGPVPSVRGGSNAVEMTASAPLVGGTGQDRSRSPE